MVLTKKIIVSVALLLAFSLSVLGQDILEYGGQYKIGQYVGDASFNFSINQGDTILKGPFRMKHANISKLLSNQDNQFLFVGGFDNGIPSGPWKFQFGNFQFADQTEVASHQYRVKVNGVEHNAFGRLVGGRPDGEWVQLVQRIKESEVEEDLFKSILQFSNGIPRQSFRIEGKEAMLIGRFLRDGLAHDVWELYSFDAQGAAESWHFSDGWLKKIIINRDGETEVFQAYTDKPDNQHVINLDTRYLEVVKSKQRLTVDIPVELEGDMLTLLAENFKYYSKIDNILSSFGEARFMPAFKVKAAHYPLGEEELELLSGIKAAYLKTRAISNRLLKSSQLKILKLADQEVLNMLLVTSEFDEKHLAFLEQIVEYQERDILAYLPRDGLLKRIWEGDPIAKTLTIYTEEKDSSFTFTGPNANSYNLNAAGVYGVHQLAEYTYSSIDSIRRVLNRKLKIEERQQELLILEEELIKEMNALDSLTDSLSNESSTKEVLTRLKQSAKGELSKYSKKEDSDTKPNEARELIQCFEEMQILTLSIAKVPDRWLEIKKTYTDQVWNPFTSTVMEEELKKRITDAYKEILIPHLLNQVQVESLCEQTQELTSLLDASYQRMLELRQEDTDRLERKLKREKNPEDILQLFGISANQKTLDQ